ncbi:MAG TPA: PAS domain S-box protein, partial [Spirochaetota bacterium]|nr:PAS domain S-box protein [Spirochaetota bacterium]
LLSVMTIPCSRKNLIIYYTLIIFFIPIATIGIGAIGTIFITSKQALVDKNSLLLENISNNIDKKIDHSIRELEVFEFYTENESSLFSKNIDNLAKSILGDKNYFESIYICDKNGQLLYTNPFLKEIQDINYSELEYIKRTIFTKKTLLETRFLNEEDNNLRIIINYPILKNDTLLGVISGTINLNDIEKTIEFQKNKELGLNIAILDDKNNLIYYSNNNKYVNISELLKKSKEISGLNIVKINNIKNVVFHRFVPKLKWNIVLTQEISFAFKTAYFLRSIVVIYFIIGVLITILTIILGYYLIFRPLIEISYLTAKIAHNDYNLTFKDSLIKELNILAHNFNRMTKKILVKEKQLIDSEFKYRKLIEESLDFFFKVSDKMKFTFISPSIEKTIGYTSEEFLKGFTKHLRTNKNNKKIINVSKMIFETQKIPEPFVFEIISKSGEIHILEIQLTPIIEDNHVVELQGSARDITMRYNVEKEINYLKNYLYSIIESMPSAVITMNQLGIINQFNSTAKKMIGVDDSDIKGKVLWNISERFHDYKKYFMESLAKNTSLEFREEIKVNNKEIKYYNITFFPLNIMEQKEIVIRIDDVTKIEKAELQLRQAQKLEIIGTMAGGLAHDFNNILGAILGTLTLIEYRTKNKKTISYNILQDDLKTIKDASSKATGIIQQLMTL